LDVKVGDITVTKANLHTLLETFSGQEGFTANLFYQAFTNPTHKFPVTLPWLQEVTLYLMAGDVELPKRIAMIRKTGMKIFEKPFRSVIPFCGVFMCRNDIGNKLLREMEPPRHDVWDADHPEKGTNRKIESEYVNFIRDCIRKLTPVDESKVISIPGLNRFLPDDDETPEENFDGAMNDAYRQETSDRSPLPEKIPGRKIDYKEKPKRPPGDAPADIEEPDEPIEPGEHNGKPKKPHPKPGPNADDVKAKPLIPIRYRTYAQDSGTGVYSATVLPEETAEANAMLVVSIVGDDQKALAEIKSARFTTGGDIPISKTGVLGPIKFKKGEALKLEIILSEPLRVAMEVSAYEA